MKASRPEPQAIIAARAYFRILNNITEGWEELEACDAHYDAGEWSGPAWGKNWEEAEDRAARAVLNRMIWVSSVAFDYAIGYLEVMPTYFEQDAFEKRERERSSPEVIGYCSNCFMDMTGNHDCNCFPEAAVIVKSHDCTMMKTGSCSECGGSLEPVTDVKVFESDPDMFRVTPDDHVCTVEQTGSCICGAWMDPAGGIHDDDEDEPAKMYE